MRLSTDHEPVELRDVDLYAPSFYAHGDPHAVWRTLRAEAPVFWQRVDDDLGFWVLTKYDDVCDVLRRFGPFTSELGNLLTTLGKRDMAGGKMLAVTDPPQHTAVKRQINAYFTPAAVARFEPALRELARRVLAPGAGGVAFDLAAASALYPIAFTALVMGIDQRDWARLKRFAYVAIADQDPDSVAGQEAAPALERAHSEIFAYFMVELGKSSIERDDLTGALARAEADGRPLSREERIFNLYSVLLGATVTTSHAVNAGVLALMEQPDQHERWRRLGCTRALVEEVLRWSSPANHFMRYATEDVELRGTRIAKGDPVTVWLGSANRDEDVFDDPYAFDISREPNRHIAFGVGAHRCIGAPMARLALEVFFDEALRLVERFEPAGPAQHLASNFIAGIKSLPVRAVPREGQESALARVAPLDDP